MSVLIHGHRIGMELFRKIWDNEGNVVVLVSGS